MKSGLLRIETTIRCATLLLLAWLIGSTLAYAGVRVWAVYLRMTYPFPYRELVTRYSRETGLDPFLVAALIRNESRFRPNAVSAEGATGLMQLIPQTANWAAREMGLGRIDPERLKDPELNLRLGTWYLAYLLQQFDGRVACALAAYNSGIGNVNQWLSEGIWPGGLENVDRIPFPETRNFVRNVIRDSERYARLYLKESRNPASASVYFPGNVGKNVEGRCRYGANIDVRLPITGHTAGR